MSNNDKRKSSGPIATEDVEAIVEVLETMVCAIVDNEEAVEVTTVLAPSGTSLILEVRVAERDMSFVMGQQGRNAEAIKTIINAMCKKLRVAFMLNIVERK